MPRQSNLPEKILSALFEDPTITRKKLSERLGVTYQAIQKHINLLEKEGSVAPALLVMPSKLRSKPRRSLFLISIKTRYAGQKPPPAGEDYQRKLCKEIASVFEQRIPLVEGIIFGGTNILIGGNADIVLTLHSESQDAVGDFVTQFLRTRKEIVETSTAWSLSPNIEVYKSGG
jgi:DNA-binding Lrp family transcriptional regulator